MVAIAKKCDAVLDAVGTSVSRARNEAKSVLGSVVVAVLEKVPAFEFRAPTYLDASDELSRSKLAYRIGFTLLLCLVIIAAFTFYDGSFSSFAKNSVLVIVCFFLYVRALTWVNDTNIFYDRYVKRLREIEQTARSEQRAKFADELREIGRRNEAANAVAAELTRKAQNVIEQNLRELERSLNDLPTPPLTAQPKKMQIIK